MQPRCQRVFQGYFFICGNARVRVFKTECSRLVTKKLSNASQNLRIHKRCNSAGLRVLLAGMIYAEQPRRWWWQLDFSAMREAVRRARRDEVALLQYLEVGIPGDATQNQNCPRLQDADFALHVSTTVQDFAWQWFIVWRGTPRRGSDVTIDQLQTVIAPYRYRLVRESSFVKCGKKKIAGAVASKYATGAISSMSRGSESDNQ